MNNISISQLSARSSPFKTTSVSTTTAYLKYRRNKNKVYARLERLRQSLGLGRSSDHVPFGIKESASGVVTFKKFRSSSPTIVTEQDTINPRKRKKPGLAPNQFSTAGDRMNSASAPVSGAEKPGAHPGQDTHPDDKGFYENLPFHGIQNPPNKPISIIAPFNQPSFVPTKSLVPSQQGNASFGFPQTNPKISAVKRNQSFHGFQNTFNQPPHPLFPHLPMFYFSKNFSNPYLTQGAPPQSVTNLQFSSNFLPAVSQHLNTISNPKFDIKTPNPFNVMTSPRIVGRNETQFDIRRSASGINKNSDDTNSKNTIKKPKHTIIFDKQFGSLEIKKHKCYSPIFYSMRCKKHAKKRPVIYALPKKCTNKSKSSESSATIFTTNSSNNPLTSTEGGFENLSDSIQISEEVSEKKEQPKPAPRCKKHRDKIYANIPINHTPSESNKSLNSSTESPQNVHDVSTTEAQVHVSNSDIKTKEPTNVENEPKTKIISATPKPKNIHLINLSPTGMKNSPTLKVSPNFVKPKTQSPKGALSLQIQAKLKASPVQSPSDNPSTSILTKKTTNNDEEIPVPVENIPPMPIIDMQARKSPKANSVAVAVSKAEQNAFYTLTTPHYKQAVVPPQYAATIPHQKHTKIIPRALFQEQLPKSKSFSSKSKKNKHFQIPLQKCHSFKFQTAESYFQPIKNIHEQNLMRNGYAPDMQKQKGPLVVAHRSEQFPEDVVRLQYPQPVVGRQNGVVYADLAVPKGSASGKKQDKESTQSAGASKQKKKQKTEYATLQFNDVGQEIDV